MIKPLLILLFLTISLSSHAVDVICVDDFNSDTPTVAPYKRLGTQETKSLSCDKEEELNE